MIGIFPGASRYELIFPERVGENYSLDARAASQHGWYSYPEMTADECLLFKVYDKQQVRAKGCFFVVQVSDTRQRFVETGSGRTTEGGSLVETACISLTYC